MSDDNPKDTSHLKLLKEIQSEAKANITTSCFMIIENNLISAGTINHSHELINNCDLFTVLIKINGHEFEITELANIAVDDAVHVTKALLSAISKAIEPNIMIEAERMLRKFK